MRNRLVYDLPMRLFHWIFAALFVTAFLIGKTVDDESPTFSLHMLAGLLLGFTVLLRIIWGLVGARYSRFESFALHPLELLSYFKGILSGDKRKWAGHNPASSWAAIAMFTLAIGLGTTGYLMTSAGNDSLKEIHELLANGFLIVVLMHIAGVILHSLRHRDGLALSMIDGAKSDVSESETIAGTRPVMGLVFLGLVATFAFHLANNFDSQKRTLNFFGQTLQLGESEEDEGREGHKEREDSGELGEKSEHSEQSQDADDD